MPFFEKVSCRWKFFESLKKVRAALPHGKVFRKIFLPFLDICHFLLWKCHRKSLFRGKLEESGSFPGPLSRTTDLANLHNSKLVGRGRGSATESALPNPRRRPSSRTNELSFPRSVCFQTPCSFLSSIGQSGYRNENFQFFWLIHFSDNANSLLVK